MKATLFLTACLVSIPTAIAVGTIGATWWYEAVWLKRIAG